MKKYRVIATGNNDLVINDMFEHLSEEFEFLSCSSRQMDITRHIELLSPDVFIICLKNETVEEMAAFSDIKRILTSKGIFTIIIGKEDECNLFQTYAVQVADVVLVRPLGAERIKNEILELMGEFEQEKEGQRDMLYELEQLKQAQHKKHVLVIDDDPTMLKLVKEYVGDKYTVATAVSGRVAYRFLETKTTNIILLDYEMPEENGVEVLKKLRENPKLSKVPILFLTGVIDKAKMVQALSLRPQGYLLKPIDREKLLGMLEKFIG